MKLIDIPELKAVIASERTSKIRCLHKLLFDFDGDRQNRSRIREFSGFEFQPNDKDFNEKAKLIEEKLSLNELITISNLLLINNEGTKKEIVLRLLTYLCDLDILNQNIIRENDSGSDSENENEQNRKSYENLSEESVQLPVHNVYQSNISFNDIESIIMPFDGDSHQSIEKWIELFEDAVNLFNLSDLHKLVFGKRSLKGKAKLYIQSETGVNSWGKLKNLLLSEFGYSCNSAELHEMLSKRKLKDDESLEEYFLKMKQLCTRGNVEDTALMQYVINGIPDSVIRKSILYGCQNLSEFKQKLRVYEKMRSDYDKAKPNRPKFGNETKDRIKVSKIENKDKFKDTKLNNIRCFNCGALGHKSSVCENKIKGIKCFKCNKFGDHLAKDCTIKKEHSNVTVDKTTSCENLTTKIVRINDLNIVSLIDTGSQKTLIKKSIFDKIGEISELEQSNIKLSGLGNTTVKPLGIFKTKIIIDDLEFESEICVVSDSSLSFDFIVGCIVINQCTLIVSGKEIKFTKPSDNSLSDSFLINVAEVMTHEPEIDLTHIQNKAHQEKVLNLIRNYKPNKIKKIDVKMNIRLTSDIPINSSPRRFPFIEKEIINEQIEQWLKDKIIRPSTSEYSSPVVLVKKKDGSSRLCIDYRRLNKITVREHFPLPLIDDLLDRLQSANIFSTLDLKNAFFHVDIDPSSKKYTSFVTDTGQYEFNKMSFGLTNSPSVFQRYIYNVFRDLIKENVVMIYLDDLVIFSENETQGIERLQRVLKTASEYGLELNIKKCQFLKREIEFLGHRIKDGKLYASPLKIKAVMNFPEPKCTKDIRSYLGLTGYFRKFIPHYSAIAKPLSDLLKKDSNFSFGLKERESFNELKQILSKEPVLCLYNPKSETEIHTDASIDGFGACLLQKSIADNQLHPVYYMSRKTSDTERKYSSYELEVMAVIEALKKFRPYVLGIPFKIVTDCIAFKQTMSKKDISSKIARWALMLEEYDYVIEHRQGTRMRHVDALSRNPVCMIIQDSLTLQILKAQNSDENVKAIKDLLKIKNHHDDYIIKGDLLYKSIKGNDLLVVPEDMQMSLIKSAHEKGHFSVKRTEDHLINEFYIPKLKQKIEKCISNCITCILASKKQGKQEGELHPIPKVELPLDTYHVDHLGPLESTNKNYKHILCVIDSFTKFVWLYPTKSTSSQEVISKLELQKSVFGNPRRIISDKGSAFNSKEFDDYCSSESIQHLSVTTGLPRANGQVERLNSTVISVISKLSKDDPTKWFKFVPELQRILNSTYERSINLTPFELLVGVKMRDKTDLKLRELIEEEIRSNFQESRENLRKDAKQQILKVQESNRKTYNLRRKPPNKYKINDIVAIKRTQHGPGLKFKSKFLGPYKITKIKPNDTYDVKKIGFVEGPVHTSTCAEYLKPWSDECAI
ncbi:Transposon Ty3-G Gag-Pol polyprotein, partial [Araneus ventricosus]